MLGSIDRLEAALVGVRLGLGLGARVFSHPTPSALVRTTQALLSTGFKLPAKNILLSVQHSMFDDMVHVGHDLHQLGYHLHATDLTHDYFKDKGVPTTLVKFPGAEVYAQLSFSQAMMADSKYIHTAFEHVKPGTLFLYLDYVVGHRRFRDKLEPFSTAVVKVLLGKRGAEGQT